MSPEEFAARWAALSGHERRFVRLVAAAGETAGSTAGNELVAAYAARRLRRFRMAAQAMVTLVWVAYLVAVLTLLRGASTPVLSAVAVACAAAQGVWVLRAELRLEQAIAVNR